MTHHDAQLDVKTVKTTCPYCGVGCGVLVETQTTGGKTIMLKVAGDPDHPANYGRLCSKGSKLLETAKPEVYEQVRATQPMRRSYRRQPLQATTWNDALDFTASQFANIIAEHGPNAVAFYLSGQLLTEDYYVFNKLAKGVIGTNNVDTNSRLCMSSAVSGYKRSLGADAPPACYEDIEQAECLFIAGSNMAFAHPVAFRRLEAAREKHPQRKLIVVDPRRTDTAQQADLHLAIAPGTDVMLFNGMLHIMVANGWIDESFISNHTDDFEKARALVQAYTPSRVADTCGIREADLYTAATWFAKSKSTLSLYCQGLNQASTGTDKNTSLINLHLATGHIGKVGSGPFSLTGQPNAMGGREVGGLATLLPAHREVDNPQHRAEIADFWGVKELPAEPGASAVALFDKLERGEIKAVYIACTNPAHSLPNSNKVKRALEKAQLVVVQDAYLSTETVAYADVLLPATTWAEKEGTVTNSERRISRVRAAMPALGASRADWEIGQAFGKHLITHLRQLNVLPSSVHGDDHALMAWSNAEAVFDEHRETTRGRDLDITGLGYRELDALGPQQWPMPHGCLAGAKRLYSNGKFETPNRRARFVAAEYQPVAELLDDKYPFWLNTGRLRDQWHGCSRTGTLPELFSHEATPVLAMSRADYSRLALREGDWVRVSSRRGQLALPAKPVDSVIDGQVYLPMHWGPEYLQYGAEAGGVNSLTCDAVDPYSKQPELKHAAVHISKLPQPWQTFILVEKADFLKHWLAFKSLSKAFEASYCVPVGRETTAVVFHAMSVQAPDKQLLRNLQALAGLGETDCLQFHDAAHHQSRLVQVSPTQGDEARITGFMLTGDVASAIWLQSFWESKSNVRAFGASLLRPGNVAPGGLVAKLKTVCNCMGVSEQAIKAELEQCTTTDTHATLQHLKCKLACGTQCGSCVPELKQLIFSAKEANDDSQLVIAPSTNQAA